MQLAISLRRLSFHKLNLGRAVIAGLAWGLLLTAGLTALSFADCGAACIDTVATTTAASMIFGVLACAPLAFLNQTPSLAKASA
jgi:hypothetical protein